jgi:hypothetical protein
VLDGGGGPSSAPPLAGAELLRLSVFPHAPLGCVVEESLASYEDDAEAADEESPAAPPPPAYVFVSSVKPGGNADRAGLRAGDVIVECSDLFGALADATRLGVERVCVTKT